MKKLNLGCGKDVKEGYLNVDSVKLPGVDLVCDLDKYPWPFKKDSFDEIYCDNVLEHLSSITEPVKELWRVSKKDSKVIIKVPCFPSIWSFTDPTHKSVYTYLTFNYFRPSDGLNYYTKARFEIIKRKILFHAFLKPFEIFFNLSESMQKFYYFFLSSIIQPRELYFELRAIK